MKYINVGKVYGPFKTYVPLRLSGDWVVLKWEGRQCGKAKKLDDGWYVYQNSLFDETPRGGPFTTLQDALDAIRKQFRKWK